MQKEILLCFALITFSFNANSKSSLSKAGDLTQILVPAGAFAIATYKQDIEGQKEFGKSFLTIMAITYTLKYALKDTEWGTRPNGGDCSFPSGHTVAASSGAFFLNTRYGLSYGAPSMALAAFTGYTRVKGKYHHWRDVLGGAAISFGVNYFFVDKYQENLLVSNVITKNQTLIALDMKF